MKNMLFALFPSMEETDSVTRDLGNIGISQDRVSVIRQQDEAAQTLTEDKAPKVKKTSVQGAEMGAAGGATAGVIGGLVLGASGPLGFLPGILAAAATGVGGSILGGITGGLVGTLVGVGFPEGAAKSYEQGIKNGQLLLGTTLLDKSDEQKVKNVYSVHGGQEIQMVPVGEDTAPQPV